MRVTKTVGATPPVSNINPDGAFKIIVPAPISAVTPSAITGPVKEVNAPPAVSAEIDVPPEAGVTVTAAKTVGIKSPPVPKPDNAKIKTK